MRALAVMTVMAVSVTACGGNETPEKAADASSGAEGGGELEKTELTVATLPLIAMAPFFYAVEEGLFEAEGLTVTPQIGAGGAELVPRLLAGELDLAFSAYTPAITAVGTGIDLQVVANGYNYPEVGEDIWGWFVMPDSDIQTLADLEGRKVASNTFQSPGELLLATALDMEGIPRDSVEVVEIPFPQMAPALERGEVDAVWLGEPFLTGAMDRLKVRAILDPDASEPLFYDDPAFLDFPVGGWMSTGDWVAENPNTAAAFRRAMEAASAEIDGDHELGAKIAGTYTETPPEVLARVEWPTYPTLSQDALQTQADLMHKVGFTPKKVDVSPLLEWYGQ
jgi:NitT/TauT family transport system substrate-binding protein